MNLISNIGMLIVIALIIIYVNNNIAIKLKNNDKINHKNNNKIHKNKINSRFLDKGEKHNLENYQKTHRIEFKSNLKLSKQLIVAKTKCWDAHHTGNRIINGTNAEKNTLPWMAAILQKEDSTNKRTFQCGASLISGQFVLTAAHCVVDSAGISMKPEKYLVYLGTQDLSSNNYIKRKVIKIFVHPEYLKRTDGIFSDIAIMKLELKVKFSHVVHPVCIPHLTTPKIYDKFIREKPVLVAGWGKTDPGSRASNLLQRGYGYRVKQSVCFKKFNSKYFYDPSTTLCVGIRQKEAKLCDGDSGSPVVPLVSLLKKDSIVFPVVVGIVSFGDEDCKGPDVLTKVESFIHWINECTLK